MPGSISTYVSDWMSALLRRAAQTYPLIKREKDDEITQLLNDKLLVHGRTWTCVAWSRVIGGRFNEAVEKLLAAAAENVAFRDRGCSSDLLPGCVGGDKCSALSTRKATVCSATGLQEQQNKEMIGKPTLPVSNPPVDAHSGDRATAAAASILPLLRRGRLIPLTKIGILNYVIKRNCLQISEVYQN
ncbi:hypothetical protein EJB05_16888, partial [Eragrostis curvula]